MLPTISLSYTIPDFSKAVSYSASMRPYREGAIRMESVKLNSKTILHNYGHGGGGISLAYGCAKHVVQKLFLPQNASLNEQVAVLGAGIIGLTTALSLTKIGYKVNLYTNQLPFESANGIQEMATTVAAGYWMPLKVGGKEDCEQFAIDTWNHYTQVLKLQGKTGQQLGITLLPTYCVNDDQKFSYMPVTGIIDPKDCLVTFGDGSLIPSKTFHSYVIQSAKYIPYIMSQLKNSGLFKIIKEEIKSKQHIQRKKEKYIFDCLGLNSSNIFEDEKINKGIKGHVLKFNLQEHKQVKDFILFLKTPEGRWILQVPQPQTGKLVLGISYQEGKQNGIPEIKELKKVCETARSYFQSISSRKISAKL